MIHYMIDIETTSTEANALVLAIAVVKFDEEKVINSMTLFPSHQEQFKLNRKTDMDTMTFWMSHLQMYKQLLSEKQSTLAFCFNHLLWFIDENNKSENIVWAKSPSFDLVILKDLFGKQNVPWKYSNEMDVRTAQLKIKLQGHELITSKEVHHPLADCIAQVHNVQTFLRI